MTDSQPFLTTCTGFSVAAGSTGFVAPCVFGDVAGGGVAACWLTVSTGAAASVIGGGCAAIVSERADAVVSATACPPATLLSGSGIDRYQPCTHSHEPGCAVKDAVGEGLIAQSRYRSYKDILAEVERREKRRY